MSEATAVEVLNFSYILSRPAVPTSVISKFVVANVRWRVDAELELHRRHDERAGARVPGIHLVVTARERDTHASWRFLLTRVSRMTMSTRLAQP